MSTITITDYESNLRFDMLYTTISEFNDGEYPVELDTLFTKLQDAKLQ